MVAGLLKGYADTDDKQAKDNHYKLIQELANEFKSVYQTYNCNELLGNIGKGTYVSSPRTAEYYKTRPCVNFVVTAAEILDKKYDFPDHRDDADAKVYWDGKYDAIKNKIKEYEAAKAIRDQEASEEDLDEEDLE